MDIKTIEEINDHHIRHVDRFYRMFSGLSSRLTGYVGETLFLSVSINARWPKDANTTAKQIANSWTKFNPQLAGARFYDVSIQKMTSETGCVLNVKTVQDQNAMAKWFQHLNQPNQLIGPPMVIKGVF